MKLLTKLYPYQKKGIRRLIAFDGRALVADEMGLGKTITSIGYYVHAAPKYPNRPAVIVCPAGLRFNWQNEFRVHAGVPVCILEGRKAKPENADPKAKVYVIGYEILGRAGDPDSWAYYLKKKRPFLIVVDECHKIKSRATKQTKNVFALGKTIPHRIPMSGTPVVNRPAELWPSLHFARPDLYPSFRAFADKHCRPERKPWGWEFEGAENLDELHADLTLTMMIRRLKEDVLAELPPKVRHVVPLDIVRPDEYRHAHDDFVKWMRQFHRGKMTQWQRAKALTQSGYLLRLAAELKLPAVLSWTKDWLDDNPGKKLILFGKQIKVVTTLFEAFKKRAVLVYGAVSMKRRDLYVKAFQNDPKCRLFVGQIDAAGVGWNGTAASAVAFGEFDWRPGVMRQAEDRGHRIGQKKSLDCFYLTAHGTFEEKVAGRIQEKQAVANEVMDGHAAATDQMTVLDMLLSIMKED